MPLSPEEIIAAKRMYRFVRSYQRVLEYPRWMMWGGGAHIFLFNALIQLLQGYHSTIRLGILNYIVGWLSLAVAIAVFASHKVKERRYRESAVIITLLEREHPDEFVEIRKEQVEAESKFRLFQRPI